MDKLNIIKLTTIIVTILFLNGCSSKITIKSIKPSLINDKDIKNIAINDFKNDTISLSSTIESTMNKVNFNGKKYFNIVNRKQSDTILKEQKLQDSGIVNIKESKNYGLEDISSIVTGIVNFANNSKDHFYVTRKDYNTCLKYKNKDKEQCIRYKQYRVLCTNHNFGLNTTITISKVSNSTIIFKENYNKKKTIQTCEDRSNIIPNTKQTHISVAKNIANDFVSTISPTFQYFNVELREDEDIDYTNKEENLLENGLKMIELGHIKESKDIFEKLVDSTKSKSVTALYNLGSTYEYLGDLNIAYELYTKAYNISILNEIDKNILLALKRVKSNMINKNIANKQINYK